MKKYFALMILLTLVITLNIYLAAKYCRNGFLLLLDLGIFIPALILIIFSLFWRHFYLPLHYTSQLLKKVENGEYEDYQHLIDSSPEYLDYDMARILKHFQKTITDEYKESLLHDHTTIQMLQSQINPHFLYNALENIRSMALKEDIRQIADMTEALALFFRYNISYKGEIITLEEELTNADHYFIIQQFRFNHSFELKVILDGCDDHVYQQIIPKLTLQPIIENAIYHGLEPKLGSKRIKIRITETARRLIILISDNGIGIPEKELLNIQENIFRSTDPDMISRNEDSSSTYQHNGIALSNIHQRIQLLFGDDFGLLINSTLNIGTDVEITLPLMSHSDMVNYEKGNS